MKKSLTFIVALAVSLFSVNSFAQDKQIFNHVGLGLTVGLDGVGAELVAPLTPYVQIRGGYSIFPYTYKRTEEFKMDDGSKASVPMSATLWKNGTGKVLIDLFPGKYTGFHLTVGAYIGNGKIAHMEGDLSNALDQEDWATVNYNGVSTDKTGKVLLDAKAGSFIPYVGLGFGRPIKPSRRVGVSFDLGVLYTGGVAIQSYNFVNNDAGKPVVITSDFLKNMDADDQGWVDKISAFPICPMIKLNIFFGIF